jgi:hypothetical protein
MKKYCILFICIYFSAGTLFSQLWIQPVVGLTVPMSDYSGSIPDYYQGKSFGLSPGVNFGLCFSVNSGIPHLNLDFGVNYSILKNSGSSATTTLNDYIELKQNLLIIYAGPTYFFLHTPHQSNLLHPYFGVNLLYSNIFGSVTFARVQNVPDGSYDMQTADRLGIGFKIGNNFELGTGVGLEIEFSYNLINAFSKSYSGGSSGRINTYQSLNDDRDPFYSPGSIEHPVSNSRSISVFQMNLGFYFMK